MKIAIEEWIGSNDFSDDVIELFHESIKCYKFDANRASLLLSYLAFATVLKERVIQAQKPKIYEQDEWDKIVNTLNDEDKWDFCIFDATQQKAVDKTRDKIKVRHRDPIFDIDENLRDQIKYWRGRRNDCAHYKNNIIDSYHIDCFWAFIMSNLSKITIEGGMNSLLNKFKVHLNPNITSPDKDISPLLKEIQVSVEKSKYSEFWKKLLPIGEDIYELSTRKKELINLSLVINSDKVNTPLLKLLKENIACLSDFLSSYPDKITRFNLTEEEIRQFWKKDLIYCTPIFGIYTTLLKYSLVPQKEIQELHRRVLLSVNNYTPNEDEHRILRENNFLDSFKEVILNNTKFIGYKSYVYVNTKEALISAVIKFYPADKEIASKLIMHYSSQYNSDFLINSLKNVFKENRELFNQYKQIVEVENNVPYRLKELFEITK